MHKKIKKHSVLLLLFIITLLQSCLRDGDPVIKMPLEFKGVEVINPTTLQLKFSKELSKATATELRNYHVVYYDEKDVTIYPVKVKVEKNKALLTFKDTFKTSVNYQVNFKNLTALDGAVLGAYGFSKTPASNDFEIIPKIEWVSQSISIKKDTRYYYSFAKKGLVTIADADVNSSLEWDFYIELNLAMFITPNTAVIGASGSGAMISTDDTLSDVVKAETYIQASDAKNEGLSILAPFVKTNRMPWCKRLGNFYGDETKPVEVLDKTIVFKTANADYGKMKIYSIYEGNPPNPVPASFDTYLLKFEYVVQTDHSDNLDIKKQ